MIIGKNRVYKQGTPNALSTIKQLTTRQRAHIQTFPMDFQFENLGLSRCDMEQLIGNAVPVLLAHFVAEQLREYMREERNVMEDERQAFSAWLREKKGYSDRSISDVFSRLKRAAAILPDKDIDRYFIVDLERTQLYQSLSTSVKSQIRKAISLKLAYLDSVIDK